MKEPRSRRRYVSLLRKQAYANCRDLKSAASTAKFKHPFFCINSMRLRRKNSFQASKLPRSLRSSPLRHHGRSSLHSFDSPETLTKKGKVSRVSERSIVKVSIPSIAHQEEREEGKALVTNRRMTRGMDGQEIRTTLGTNALRHKRIKGSHADKVQKQRKRMKHADTKSSPILEASMVTDNASYKTILNHQGNNSTESKVDKGLHKVSFSAADKNSSKRLTRIYQASKSQGQDLLKSSQKQRKLLSGGVITRQKTGSTAEDQPPLDTKRETKLSQCTKSNYSPNEEKQKRPFIRGMQEEAVDRFHHGDTSQSAHTTIDQTKYLKLNSEDTLKGGERSSLSVRSRQRKTGSELDDPRQIDSGKGLPPLVRSPRMAIEQGLVDTLTITNLKDSAVKLRRSKRKRSPLGSDCLSDHRAFRKDSEGVRDQVRDIASQDAVYFEHGSDVSGDKVKSVQKGAENETGSSLDGFKMDPASKSCLVATNPTETGGRQMRPRPLDLEQPLLVLVEGFDEDYYELDGGSFHKMLEQQPELNSPFASQAKSNGSNRKVLHTTEATGEKAESIVIPSFRICVESKDSLQHPSLPYILPNSYIKAGSTMENRQPEYDLDEEDEEWLNKYNQFSSPSSKFSVDQFEKIIDLLENKAADASGISSITESLGNEPEPVLEECCICNGGENSANNLVYQCESCHMLVHQSCYGIKKGFRNEKKRRKWNCQKCKAVAEGGVPADISCSLCCKQGGALKPSTDTHRWAHVVCALYTNETYFVNPDAMEPIDGLNAADARAKRQRRQCWLCGVREGSAERCSVAGCKSVFHVSCGVTQGASFELQHSNRQVTSVRVYCPRHALEVFGSAKGRSSEDDKEAFFQEDISQEDLCDAEKVSKTGGKRESSPTKHGIKASSQRKNHECVDYGHTKAKREILNKDHGITDSERGERVDAQLIPGMAMNGASVEEACAVLAKESIPFLGKTSPNLMEGVYLYWVSKRVKQGGPLLHRIQQEHATKQFGIFNADDENGPATDSATNRNSLKYNPVDMKVVAARQRLRRLRELSLLVVQRERLKHEIFSIDQDILKVSFEVLKATTVGQLCSFCKASKYSLVCAVCNKATCLPCLIKSSENSTWPDFLKGSKYICLDCKQQNIQMHIELECKPHGHHEEDGLAGSSMICAWNQGCGGARVLRNSQCASHKKPFILLPRSDCSHQDKVATQAFWDRAHPKTVLLLDLLMDPV